jgi:hypothetical protein
VIGPAQAALQALRAASVAAAIEIGE